jgi:hypothetical protein
MKRSAHVAAPLLASAAVALLTACRKPEMQRCVDENNRVVADNFCANQPVNQLSGQPTHSHSGIGYIPIYRYYYGGYGGYGLGSIVSGGGYSSLSGHSYATSSGHVSGTSRGGFGSSFGGGHSGGGE